MQTRFLCWAGILGFLGVAMGAFGAHALKPLLSDYQMDIYKTAVTYQMWHVLLLVSIACLPKHRWLDWAGVSVIVGIWLFSGSLYALAIFNLRWLGVVTPFGGMAFLLAWGLLAAFAWRQTRAPRC